MWNLCKKSGKWLLGHIFPSYCIACTEPLSSPRAVCSSCAHEIELLSPLERCPFCFTLTGAHKKHCPYCLDHPPHPRLFGAAACLEESDVTRRLLQHLEYSKNIPLELAFASLALLQLQELKWPRPEFILLEPSHWLSANRKELALSHRLARHLAELLKVPCRKPKLDITSLTNPEFALEARPPNADDFLTLSNKKDPLHKMNVLAFSLIVRTGRTWKLATDALEQNGLVRAWHLSLIAGSNSWIHTQ